jgi:hypothetical protein
LGVERLEVLADAGYSNGEHLDICERKGITVTLPRRIIPGSPAGLFQKKDFVYHAAEDIYRCPAGQILTRGGQDISISGPAASNVLCIHNARKPIREP